MEGTGYYGVATLSPQVFKKLNQDFFISGSSENVKYMCANDLETVHLKELGVCFSNVEFNGGLCCDWYKLIKDDARQ